jgi:competence protein ComEA
MDAEKTLTPAELAARLRMRLAEGAEDRPVCHEVVDVVTGEPEIAPLSRRSMRQRFSEVAERFQAKFGLSRSNRWVLAMVAVVAAAAGLFVTVLSWPSSSEVAAVGESVEAEERPTPTIVVSVAGAVVRPGIVELESGARVADAIEAAGGLTEDAEIGFLNLARVVSDGDLVAVPDGSAGGAVGEAGGGAPRAAGGGLVNVNVAGPETLETLNGIGPVLAERIVAYREANGSFQSVEALAEVQGIGPRLLEQLRDQVTL